MLLILRDFNCISSKGIYIYIFICGVLNLIKEAGGWQSWRLRWWYIFKFAMIEQEAVFGSIDTRLFINLKARIGRDCCVGHCTRNLVLLPWRFAWRPSDIWMQKVVVEQIRASPRLKCILMTLRLTTTAIWQFALWSQLKAWNRCWWTILGQISSVELTFLRIPFHTLCRTSLLWGQDKLQMTHPTSMQVLLDKEMKSWAIRRTKRYSILLESDAIIPAWTLVTSDFQHQAGLGNGGIGRLFFLRALRHLFSFLLNCQQVYYGVMLCHAAI